MVQVKGTNKYPQLFQRVGMMGRNLIIGDIHSRYEKLMAVLDKASFDPSLDILYSVGDFCDRGKDAVKTLRFLMGLKDFRAVIGNHDIILQDWLRTGVRDDNWTHYLGGSKTVKDILYRHHLDQQERIAIADWLWDIPLVRVEDKYIIIHGGIPSRWTMADLLRCQARKGHEYSLMTNHGSPAWNRDYMLSAYAGAHPEVKDEMFTEVEPFETGKTIFVGHTPTLDGKPFISERYHLIALDTGAGGNGPLTLMDMDTLGYWQA